MTGNIEKQLLDEIIKRDKELNKLKDAYAVLTGSEYIGVRDVHVKVPVSVDFDPRKMRVVGIGKDARKKDGKVVRKVIVKKGPEARDKVGARIGGRSKGWAKGVPLSDVHKKKIGEAISRHWARRREELDSTAIKKPGSRFSSKEELHKFRSEKMKEYWANKRAEKAASKKEEVRARGIPTKIETQYEPTKAAPLMEEPVEPVERGKPSTGRLSFVPVGRVRRNRAWVEEEDSFLKEMWGKRSVADLAQMLMRTVGNVEKRYAKLKADEKYRQIVRKPMTNQGKKFQESYRKSWDKGLTKTKSRWSMADEKRLLRLAKEGKTTSEISQELKRSAGSIRSRYRNITGDNVIPADRERKKKRPKMGGRESRGIFGRISKIGG